MPYKSKDTNRAYQREYKRLNRAGDSRTPGQTLVPLEFRIRTAQDVLNLLAEQIGAVRAETSASTLEKARVIGFLAGAALKAVEVSDLAGRLEAMESVLKARKEEAA